MSVAGRRPIDVLILHEGLSFPGVVVPCRAKRSNLELIFRHFDPICSTPFLSDPARVIVLNYHFDSCIRFASDYCIRAA